MPHERPAFRLNRDDDNVSGRDGSGRRVRRSHAIRVRRGLELCWHCRPRVRQRVNETFTVMAGMEWTNWSRMQIVPLKGSPAGSSLTFNYEDGWIFSLGADYNINNDLTFRAGLSYEITPTIDQARSMRLPDADRIWTSVGASYKYDERLSIDVGYTHLFVEDAPVD
ncbi:hypothetical protein G5V57_26925 [Nordella sp. HKS 07]|uniref:OmpP1/FadL family transporter n=1 Tax=Nordella sp. HKS 07 TaxID=2712222 RepID=UPI0013E1AF47|nr:outer membrane protein transport protein [Nordella sp. HKS 07]QIG51041.1 hypothetical protein G5V57_26925 [Nordella sp. HKS 07]